MVSVRIKRTIKKSTVLEVVLAEGLNREIRRALARLEHKVMRLRRVAIGPLTLGKLAPGEHRLLQPAEVEALRRGETSIGYRERPHRARRRRSAKQGDRARDTRNASRPHQTKKPRTTRSDRGRKPAAPH
jgi:23S rRNA pseudouridine2605 synthase